MKKNKTRGIVFSGLMIALVFVATFSIRIPVPFTQGYIHSGDSMVFVSGILFGWQYGAIAGGIGSGLADIISGYTHWALPTLIIKGIMGGIVGFVATNKSKKANNTITLFFVSIWGIFSFSLIKLLNNKIVMNKNGKLANQLVNKLELANVQELIDLVNNASNILSISMIIIPILILVLYFMFKNKDKELFSLNSLIGMTIAGLWMILGYYFAGGLLVGNMITPIFSIPSNMIQFVGGLSIAFIIITSLKKINMIESIRNKLNS